MLLLWRLLARGWRFGLSLRLGLGVILAGKLRLRVLLRRVLLLLLLRGVRFVVADSRWCSNERPEGAVLGLGARHVRGLEVRHLVRHRVHACVEVREGKGWYVIVVMGQRPRLPLLALLVLLVLLVHPAEVGAALTLRHGRKSMLES